MTRTEPRFLSDPLRTIEHMLPDSLFGPLDLDDLVEDTVRGCGATGVVDLLVSALLDPRVRRERDIDAYLDRLKSACRQTRRYRDAIPVLHKLATLNPERRAEVAAEIALVYAHCGDPRAGVATLEAAYAEQRRLPARRRSLVFCLRAELAAMALRHAGLTRSLAVMARTAGQAKLAGRAADRSTALETIERWWPRSNGRASRWSRPRPDPPHAGPAAARPRRRGVPVVRWRRRIATGGGGSGPGRRVGVRA